MRRLLAVLLLWASVAQAQHGFGGGGASGGAGATPGGSSGDIQTNDGASGFAAYAGDSCAASNFVTDIGADGALTCAVPGGAGDITDVWGCTSGNCNAITAATGDSIDASGADSTIPWQVETADPGTCTANTIVYNSTDTLPKVCTATNVYEPIPVVSGTITDGAVARFTGTTGELEESACTIADSGIMTCGSGGPGAFIGPDGTCDTSITAAGEGGFCQDTTLGATYCQDGAACKALVLGDGTGITAGAIDATDLGADSVGASELATGAVAVITDIAAGLKSGADATVITGTAGTSGHCGQWNADGDLVTTGAACGGGGGTSIVVTGHSVNLSTSQTQYLPLGIGDIGTAESGFSVPAPVAGTISDMRCSLNAAPGAGTSRTFALRINGAASSPVLNCTISDTATSCGPDTDDVTIAAGDTLGLESSMSGTPAAARPRCAVSFASS